MAMTESRKSARSLAVAVCGMLETRSVSLSTVMAERERERQRESVCVRV